MLNAEIPAGWYRVLALTYEFPQGYGGPRVLAVRHEMYGPTPERAMEVYRAHVASDRFLRECSLSEGFRKEDGGVVACTTETELQGPF